MGQQKYHLEQIVVAAAFSTCMTELLVSLDAPTTPGSRAAMWARLGRLDIDTTHWRRSARTSQRYDDEALARAVAESISIAGVLRALGIRPAGGSHFSISNRILVMLPEGFNRTGAPRLRRAMVESGVRHCCEACGTGPVWHGRPLTLAVDHVNGNWLDNRLENLRFLCPNCHAQTSTWCRRKTRPTVPS